MAYFDTLIRLDTLIISSNAGCNRQTTKMEVRIQHENTNHIRGKTKEFLRVHRLLRDLQQSRGQKSQDSILV